MYLDRAVAEDLLAFTSDALCCVYLALKEVSVDPRYFLQPSTDGTLASYIKHSSRHLLSRGDSAGFLQLQCLGVSACISVVL